MNVFFLVAILFRWCQNKSHFLSVAVSSFSLVMSLNMISNITCCKIVDDCRNIKVDTIWGEKNLT